MSKLEVDKIDPQSGTDLELGTSGDTVTIPTGVTLDASNATTTLPANVVTTDGTQTLTNKTIDASQLSGTITPSDGTVTNAKIVDSTIALAKLSATGTKDSTTFLRGDNTFAEAGGGAYELLSTTNVSSAVATVDFTSNIDSTYKNYLFTYTDVRPVTDGARLELRFFSSAGSPDTGVKYRYASRSLRDNGDSSNAVSGVGGDGTIVTMAYYTGTDADDLLSGQFILHNPAGTDGRKLVHGTSTGMQTDTATFYSYFSANYAETSNAVTGVRFFFNSGNIEKGIFKLYGIN